MGNQLFDQSRQAVLAKLFQVRGLQTQGSPFIKGKIGRADLDTIRQVGRAIREQIVHSDTSPGWIDLAVA
jgi:hypothetical protein